MLGIFVPVWGWGSIDGSPPYIKKHILIIGRTKETSEEEKQEEEIGLKTTHIIFKNFYRGLDFVASFS